MSYHYGDIKLLRLQFYTIFDYTKVDPKDNLAFFRILHRQRIQDGDTIDIPWTQMVRGGDGLYFYELAIDDRFRENIDYTIEYMGTYAEDMSIGSNSEEIRVENIRNTIEDYLMYASFCKVNGRSCCR